MYIEILYHGCLHFSDSYEGVIRQMKLLDWTCPETILKFKENVQTRLLVFNELILFHDAQSFLEACLEAGIIDSLIVDPDYVPLKTNVQYMRLETNENDLRFD